MILDQRRKRKDEQWVLRARSKSNGVEKDPSPALLRRAPSPLGEGCDFDFRPRLLRGGVFDFYPSPLGRGCPGISGRVRGLFAGDASMDLEVCVTRDISGTLNARLAKRGKQGVGNAHGGEDWSGIMDTHDVCAAQDAGDHSGGITRQEES